VKPSFWELFLNFKPKYNAFLEINTFDLYEKYALYKGKYDISINQSDFIKITEV